MASRDEGRAFVPGPHAARASGSSASPSNTRGGGAVCAFACAAATGTLEDGRKPLRSAACARMRAASRSSDFVCDAITARRSRDVPSGTVGGLLVPLTREHTVRDLAVALALPLVIAARPGLGTISHTLLTIEAARTAGLSVAAVVLTPWPDDPSVMERSNRETIARLGDVEVAALARLPDGSPESLAAGGTTLPLAAWLRAPR